MRITFLSPVLFLTVLCINRVHGKVSFQQNEPKEKYIPIIRVIPHAGVSWQSTLFKPIFDFSWISELFYVPYPINFEKGTQGFGMDLGLTALFNLTKRDYIGIRPNLRMRYDYIYGIEGFPLNEDIVKKLLLDLGGHLVYSHENDKRKEWTVSAGVTWNQMGHRYYFDLSRTLLEIEDAFREFQYLSYNFGLSYDVYKISDVLFLNAALVANYIRHGHPAYPYRDFMTLGIGASVRYKPQFLQFELEK